MSIKTQTPKPWQQQINQSTKKSQNLVSILLRISQPRAKLTKTTPESVQIYQKTT